MRSWRSFARISQRLLRRRTPICNGVDEAATCSQRSHICHPIRLFSSDPTLHKLQTNAHPSELRTDAIPTRFLTEPKANDAWKVIKESDFQHIRIPDTWEQDLTALQDRIGVRFHDLTHLKCALIHHGSFAHNQLPVEIQKHRLSNRSLEFLGDSVLGLCASSHLFQSHPHYQEGQLTQAKGAIVNNHVLSKICVNDLRMHKLILVAPDYDLSVASGRPTFIKGRATIQAGAVESLIAAIYLDQGLATSVQFVNEQILPPAIKYATQKKSWEPINELQHLLQVNGYGNPVYRHLPCPISNNDTKKHVMLIVRGQEILTEAASSYKAARVKAAEAGYAYYRHLLAVPS